VLVEDAAPRGLVGHPEDVWRDREHHRHRQHPGQPADQLAVQDIGGAQHQRGHAGSDDARRAKRCLSFGGAAQDGIGDRHHHRHDRSGNQHRPDPGDRRDQTDRCQAAGRRGQQPHPFVDQLGFFFLERPQLARVVQVVADVSQRAGDFLGPYPGRVIVDQRLLVGEVDRDPVHPVQPPDSLLDGAGAQRAVQPGDACPHPGVALAAAGFLGPQRCRGLGLDGHDLAASMPLTW
jgi:hypothetical protein